MASLDSSADSSARLDSSYQACISLLKSLKQDPCASPAAVSAAAAELKLLKQQLYQRRHSPAKAKDQDPEQARACYPKPTQVPLDHDGFALSFPPPKVLPPGARPDPSHPDPSHPALPFFREHGYAVFRSVVSPARCEATRAEIWAEQEAKLPGLARADPATYGLMSSKTYGLAPQASVYTPQVVANRQDARVLGCLSLLLSCPPPSLLASHDRWCCYRPTRGLPGGDRPGWKTAGNVHLDLHPWRFPREAPLGTDVEALEFGNLRDFSREINMAKEGKGGECEVQVRKGPRSERGGGGGKAGTAGEALEKREHAGAGAGERARIGGCRGDPPERRVCAPD
jgi:hypothetical protein